MPYSAGSIRKSRNAICLSSLILTFCSCASWPGGRKKTATVLTHCLRRPGLQDATRQVHHLVQVINGVTDVIVRLFGDSGQQLRIPRVHVVGGTSRGTNGEPVLGIVPFIILLPVHLQVDHLSVHRVQGGRPDIQVPERALLQHHAGKETRLAMAPELIRPGVPGLCMRADIFKPSVHGQVSDGIQQIERSLRAARIEVPENGLGTTWISASWPAISATNSASSRSSAGIISSPSILWTCPAKSIHLVLSGED